MGNNIVQTLIVAGQLQDLGDGLIGMFSGWARPLLLTVCALLVTVRVAQRFSLKAGIGAVIAMILIPALFDSREALSTMFQDEISHPKSLSPSVVRQDPAHAEPAAAGQA